MDNKVDILAIGAHPDDVELGAGGTVIKSVNQGKKVAIVDLTQGELGSRGTAETRHIEAQNSAKIMGVSYRENLKLADGFFEENKTDLIALVKMIRKYQPEIVLANAVSDRHPDHGRGSQFITRACFLSGLVKIETEVDSVAQEKWRAKAVYHYIQDRYIKPDFVVDVSDTHEKKIQAVLAFTTQFHQKGTASSGPKTPISGEDFLMALDAKLIQYGRDIGVKFGEGFTVERSLGIADLFDIF